MKTLIGVFFDNSFFDLFTVQRTEVPYDRT